MSEQRANFVIDASSANEIIRVTPEGKVLLLVNGEPVDTGVAVDRIRMTPDMGGMLYVMQALAQRCIEFREASRSLRKLL